MRRLVLALALAGCGPTHYVTITNGGAPLLRGSCSDVALVEQAGTLAIVLPATPGCEATPGFVVAPHAAGALWKIAGGTWAGPAVANPVEVRVPVLTAGENQRGLSSGENQRGLSSGENQRGLSSGENQRGLSSGENQRSLSSGQDQRALSSGQDQRALSSGQDQRGLSSGENQRALSQGQQERSLSADQAEKPVVEVRKRASGQTLTSDSPVTFTIDVKNIGAAPLSQVAVMDRADAHLAVTGTDAQVRPLPDGTSLLLWFVAGPVDPGQSIHVEFTASLR